MPESKPHFRFSFTFDDGETMTMLTYEDARDALATELSQLNHIVELANHHGVTLSAAFTDFSNASAMITAKAMDLAKAKIIGVKRQKKFAVEVESYLQTYGKSLSPRRRRQRLIDIIPAALKEKRFDDANDAFAAFVAGAPLLLLKGSKAKNERAATDLQSPTLDMKGDMQILQRDVDDLRESHATLNAIIKEIMRVQADLSAENDKKLADADEKIAAFADIHADMKSKLALSESVSYWSGEKVKKRKHVQRLRKYSMFLVIWVVICGALICAALAHYLLNVGGTPTLTGLLPYLPINILLLLVAVWGVRIFARLILNENHLATKAEEKGAMLQTYLALLNEGNALSEDWAVALEAIFTPAQDAPIDDSMPAPPAGMLNSGK